MKDSSIELQPEIVFNPDNQCRGKHKYEFKRRALKDAHGLTKENPTCIYTVYHCPHCGKYHVGSVRKQ
jgi:hypothetical protein